MTDVDQILRDHAAAAETEPSPDGWERLVARLEEAEPPLVVPIDGRGRGARRPGHAALVVAAAVLAVVLVGGAVALIRSADEGEGIVRPADTAPPSTTAPTTTEAGTGRPDVDETTMPDHLVAVLDHDGDGLADLVALEGLGSYEEAEDAEGRPVTTIRPPEVSVLVAGSDVAPDAITSIDVGPDEVGYYAVGDEVWRVDLTSGATSGPVAEGTAPAVSGDGDSLATIVGVDIHLLDIPTGAVAIVDHLKVAGEEVTALSLSPDGQQIARQRVTRGPDGLITATAVDVMDVADRDAWVEIERSSGAGLPAFMPDGHLALGLGTLDASEGRTEVRASEVGMADLSTGAVRWSVGGGGFSFGYFDATPDGRWVMAGLDGVIRAFAAVDGWLWDEGTLVQVDGIVDAAW
jgi:hypothetical protein